MQALSLSAQGVALSALMFESEQVLPGVLVRFVEMTPRLRAMVVSGQGMDLWICAAADDPDAAGWDAAVDDMRDVDGELAVVRCAAAFGLPWECLSDEVLLGQLVLMEEGPAMEHLRGLTPDQVLALRERVHGGRPASMVKALRCLHDYAALTQ
jgi:hypothetical protein